MYRALPVVAVVSACTACAPDRIIVTSAAEIVRDYAADHVAATKKYQGHRVKLTLLPGEYRIDHDGIGIYTGRPLAPPVLRFICRPPMDTTRAIEVTGTVWACDHDERPRGSDIYCTVRIEHCTVQVR